MRHSGSRDALIFLYNEFKHQFRCKFISHITKYCEILRLTALGLSLRNIQRSLHVSQRTIMKVQHRAKELSRSWPLDEFLSDAELERQIFAKDTSQKSAKRMPDYDYIRKELLRNGVNRKLLWTEYLEECRQNGDDALVYPSSAIAFSRMSRSAAPPCTSRENQGRRSR